jgi:predicted alpha/beta superfamily hydrolase
MPRVMRGADARILECKSTFDEEQSSMKRYALSLLCAVVALGSLTSPARAQTAPRDAFETLSLHSSVLGEDRAIIVRTPAGYARGSERYPVLYMTDGMAQLGHTAATIEFLSRQQHMPEMIVVAIANTDRTRDLTPTHVESNEDGIALATSGGADAFLKFVETELIPAVESRYRTQPYRVFAGHSFGGLLAVHALATRPELFNAYIAVSPSLWWDGEEPVKRTAELFKSRKELKRSLYVTLGNEGGNMQTGYDHFRKLLEKSAPAGFEWSSMQMDDEDHGSVVLRSHYQAFRYLFADWRVPQDAAARGLEGVDAHYAKLSKKLGYTIPVPEPLINQIGYRLLAAGKSEEAIAVFKTNVERYPDSANVYDSLGEAYERAGKIDLARESYARAVARATETSDANLTIFKTNLARVEANSK